MLRIAPIVLLAAVSLLLPSVHGLHFLAEAGKPMYCALSPPPLISPQYQLLQVLL